MSDALQSLLQALAAHDSFGSLNGWYIEASPELYAELQVYRTHTVDPATPIFNSMPSMPAWLTGVYMVENSNIANWRCIHFNSGEIMEYPACMEIAQRIEVDINVV